MTTLIVAAALAMVFIVSYIILIRTTKAAPLMWRAMKRVSPAVLIMGAFVLGTACSTTHRGTSAGKPVGYVKRAIFTTAIKNHEPTNKISKLRNDKQKIYYFTDLRGMQGQKVKHRWIYKSKVMAEIAFKVKGPRWRVYSSKRLDRGWLGKWTVLAVDRRGRTLSRNSFSYAQARGFFGNKKQSKASAKKSSKKSSEEGYLDKGVRKVGEFYNDLFGGD
jgi:hypothetical protein